MDKKRIIKKTKKAIPKIIVAIVVIGIVMVLLRCCYPSTDPKEVFITSMSYTQITGNYGYIRVDSMIKSRVYKVVDGKAISRYYRRLNSVRNYSTTFQLIKTSDQIKNYTSSNHGDSIWVKINNCKKIYEERIIYDTGWTKDWDYSLLIMRDFAYKVSGEKIGNPYYKLIGDFVCFRPYIKDAIIIRNGESEIYKTLTNSNGSFQNVEPYPYYFYKGDEYLFVLDKKILNCVDTIPKVYVDEPCDDNSRFLFLTRNDNKGYLIYDIEKLNVVVDKRSNDKSNIFLEKERVATYTGFNNEQEFEGTNLLKVTFINNGKTVASLLNESTMTHTSEVLYDDIMGFNKEFLIGFLDPKVIHNVVFTNGNGKITGSISTKSLSYGRFGYVSSSNSIVDLKVSGNQTAREKDNFRFGFLISKKTGKETESMYQVFDDGQKIKIK